MTSMPVPPDDIPPAGAGAPLRHTVTRSLTWTLAETWGAPLLGLVVFAALARLLTEADFGLVALAAVFMFLAQTIVDQGFGDALIQRRELTPRQTSTAFWVAIATGALLTCAGVLLAWPLAAVFSEPELAPILMTLSATFMIAAFSSTPMALMRRDLRFRELALRRLAAVLGGGAIAVALALWGAGAWALVAQHVANAIIAVVVLWRATTWRPSFEFSLGDFRELFAFGRNVVGGELLNFTSRNADNLLIGGFLGTIALGLYAVAYKVLDITQHLLVSAAQKLAFPLFARLQGEPERMRRAYERASQLVSTITLPGYLGLALVAHEAIVFVFGERWTPSAAPAAVLFLIGPIITVQAFSGALLNAVGHPEVTLRFRLVSTTVNVVGFATAVIVFRDITAVAAAFVIRGYVLLPLLLLWLRRYAGVPLRAHFRDLRTPVLATAVMAIAVLGVKYALAGRTGTGTLLALEVAAGAVIYGLTLTLIDRALVRDVLGLLAQALPGGERAGRAIGVMPGPEQVRNIDVGSDEPRTADA